MGTRLPSLGGGGGGEREAVGGRVRGEEAVEAEGLRPPTPQEGREVRCACQYYQTDSLLPERSALAALWKHRTMGDHEYEPVAAPRPAQPPVPPVFLSWEADEDPEELKRRLEQDRGERELLEREFLRTPLDDDPGAPPVDGDNEDEAMKEIGTPPSPSPPSLSRTPTTESRTDCELTTSQVDSSGLEELPLSRSARGDGAKGPGPLATSIKRRIRNQAGRLRTKMRSIPRPTFRVPEGLMRSSAKNASAAAAADSASSAAETTESPPRTEKKRTAAHLFDFRTYPRIFERKTKARAELAKSKRTSSSHEEDLSEGRGVGEAPPRRKGPLGMRWAHRFSDIRYADEEEAVSGGTRENGSTSSLRGSAPGGSWSESGGQQDGGGTTPERRPGVLEEINADEFFLREKGLSRDDIRRGEEISSEIRDAFRPSAASEGGEPAEEGYPDEEVVEVEMTPPQRPSRKIATEWKPSEVVVDQGFMTFPPQRPKRRKGMLVRSAVVEGGGGEERGRGEEEREEEEEPRWRKGAVIVEGAIMAEHLVDEGEWEEGWGRKEEEDGWGRKEEVKMAAEEEEDKMAMEEKDAEVEGRGEEGEEGEGQKRWGGGFLAGRLRGWIGAEDEGEGEQREEEREGREEEGGGREEESAELEVEVQVMAEEVIPPLPPKRRRRAAYETSVTSLDGSRCISSEEVRMDEFDRSSTNVSMQQQLSEGPQMNGFFSPQRFTEVALTTPDPEYASPSRDVVPPVAPRRTRSLSRRRKETEDASPAVSRSSLSVPPRPQRRTKITEFFTVPRQKIRPPERPARSGYATPGPPRAPRRRRASTPLPPSIPPSEDAGCESEEDGERVRELTAGEVVSKMRGRPLPPPPRPPRRDRTRSADRSAWEEVVEGHLALGSDRGPGSMTSGRSISDTGKPPEEVSIAIQTDPLPYDYCVEERAVEEIAAAQQAERQTSEWTGRVSPVTWPTPPPTPPPVAARRHSAQRRQQAIARRAQASSQEAIPTERPPDMAEVGSRVTESILASSPPLTPPTSPPRERRVPPSPPLVSAEPITSPEVPSPDTPPSIPPLPTAIPPKEESPPPTEVEHPPPLAPTPPPVAPTDSAETAEPPAPIPEQIPAQPEALPPEVQPSEEPPKPAPPTPPTPKAVHVQSVQSPVAPPPQTEEPAPPVAPPRPPKPVRREDPSKPPEVKPPPRGTPAAHTTPFEPPISVPPPSFAQLRSPATEEQPTYPSYPYSIPPPSFFPPPTTSEDPTGRTMPPSPPMGAVALLCVGEITARKLVVSEFQGGWGPQQSPDPPPEPRRPSSRGSDWSHRRRMPSVPTVRRRTMRRAQSEGGKECKEEAEDPEDPDLPGVAELSGRLARACGNAAVSTVRQLLLTAVERVEGDGRTEAAIVIALVMAVALVLLTMGHGRQGHRWDFYLPPPN